MYWVNTMVRKLSCIEPTPKVRALFQHILHCCCACSKTSISINKYMQKTGEPENDAGFLKHNSQLNCSYSYPSSKPRLVVTVFRLHIMACLSGFNATYTRPYVYGCTMSSHLRALVMYYTPILYCVYALVGGAISIRDPYICAVHQSVPTSRTLSSTGPLSVQ